MREPFLRANDFVHFIKLLQIASPSFVFQRIDSYFISSEWEKLVLRRKWEPVPANVKKCLCDYHGHPGNGLYPSTRVFD